MRVFFRCNDGWLVVLKGALWCFMVCNGDLCSVWLSMKCNGNFFWGFKASLLSICFH